MWRGPGNLLRHPDPCLRDPRHRHAPLLPPACGQGRPGTGTPWRLTMIKTSWTCVRNTRGPWFSGWGYSSLVAPGALGCSSSSPVSISTRRSTCGLRPSMSHRKRFVVDRKIVWSLNFLDSNQGQCYRICQCNHVLQGRTLEIKTYSNVLYSFAMHVYHWDGRHIYVQKTTRVWSRFYFSWLSISR